MSAAIQEFLSAVAAIGEASLPCLQRMVECPECEGARVDGDRYCFTCEGAGEVAPEAATAYRLADLARTEDLPPCESCGEPSDDLQVVEDRDDDTGYSAINYICGDCRRAPLRREAEMYGGLRPDALMLLGIDEGEWLQEGSRPDIPQEDSAVPTKPPGRATLPLEAGELEPRFGFGGGR